MNRDTGVDENWRFRLGDPAGAQAREFDDSDWRVLDLPHDWSIEDLPPAPPPTRAVLMAAEGRWRFAPGDDIAWKEPGFDDAGWQEVELPCSWESHSGYTQDNVYGWFRRRLDLSAEMAGQEAELRLGCIDDVDETFLNGVRIGGCGSFPPAFRTAYEEQRVYRVPAGLLRGGGQDVLAVRVFDGAGVGGIVQAGRPPLRVGPFDPDASPGGQDTGHVLGGTAWYRKGFVLPASTAGQCVSLRFDGVYEHTDLWVNGHFVRSHHGGYTGFACDLTPWLVRPGDDNSVAVRVRNEGRNSRWYSGSGIYRHVWLTVVDALHVPLWGVAVTTPEASDATACVRVVVELENRRDRATAAHVRVRVVGPDGTPVGMAETGTAVPGFGRGEAVLQLPVERPRLWSPETPALYRAEVEVRRGRVVVDCHAVLFGIRTIRVSAEEGFLLNGQPRKLRGACVHHDNGPLGAAAIDRAEERRVELLKARGYDAVRTSHNPPSPAFLDACDRLGLLVMDEAFDMWRVAKKPDDYHRVFDACWREDLDAMVLRDRNHPSVVIWSVGNELPERYSEDGARTAAMLAERVRELDPTRPVTAAFCGLNDQADPFFAALDLCGYNYGRDRYDIDHQRHPQRIIVSTESFPAQAFDYWQDALAKPWVIGDFVWTGIDYIGESGIGHAMVEGGPGGGLRPWPWHVANCGDMDLCGFVKPAGLYRDVLWGVSALEILVHRPLPEGRGGRISAWGWPDEEPRWTWPGHEGRTMRVTVYSSCEQVRLLLNGTEFGTRSAGTSNRLTAVFEVPYAAGELRAVGVAGGREVASRTLRTAGHPATLHLTADRACIAARPGDLAHVTVEARDTAGTLVPDAEFLVRFGIRGPGELAAVGNGNPVDAASFHQPQRRLFRGRCLAIVRPTGRTGTITLTATAEGLGTGQVEVVAASSPIPGESTKGT